MVFESLSFYDHRGGEGQEFRPRRTGVSFCSGGASICVCGRGEGVSFGSSEEACVDETGDLPAGHRPVGHVGQLSRPDNSRFPPSPAAADVPCIRPGIRRRTRWLFRGLRWAVSPRACGSESDSEPDSESESDPSSEPALGRPVAGAAVAVVAAATFPGATSRHWEAVAALREAAVSRVVQLVF